MARQEVLLVKRYLLKIHDNLGLRSELDEVLISMQSVADDDFVTPTVAFFFILYLCSCFCAEFLTNQD